MAPRPRRRTPSAVGTAFVLVGAAAVLGVTFAAGVYTGSWWSAPGGAPAAAGPRSAARDAHRSSEARADKVRPELPVLTFYQELTAPLTAPPPPPRPKASRGDGPRLLPRETLSPREGSSPREPSTTREATSPRDTSVPHDSSGEVPATAPEDGAARSYTVQVGAYKSREPAEALRAKLAAAGHEAEIVTADAAAGARFRVRVGAYPTRDAAREAAARIAAERALPTLVITR